MIRRRQAGNSSAFSLIELLVVIGIVAVLAAILFAALGTSYRKSRELACRSNLKQIGLALSLYMADYDGTFPPIDFRTMTRDPNRPGHSVSHSKAPAWYDLIALYCNGKAPSLHCPEVRFTRGENKESRPLAGYAYNSELSSKVHIDSERHQSTGRAETITRFPASLITVFDSRFQFLSANGPDESINQNDDEIDRAERLGAIRHQGAGNYLFADGHVQRLRAERILWGTSDTPDGTRPTFLP